MKNCDNEKCSGHCEITIQGGRIMHASGFKQEVDMNEYLAGKTLAGHRKLSFCGVCYRSIEMAMENAGITMEVK